MSLTSSDALKMFALSATSEGLEKFAIRIDVVEADAREGNREGLRLLLHHREYVMARQDSSDRFDAILPGCGVPLLARGRRLLDEKRRKVAKVHVEFTLHGSSLQLGGFAERARRGSASETA